MSPALNEMGFFFLFFYSYNALQYNDILTILYEYYTKKQRRYHEEQRTVVSHGRSQ